MSDQAGMRQDDFMVEPTDQPLKTYGFRTSTNVAVAIEHLRAAKELGATPEVISLMIKAIKELER